MKLGFIGLGAMGSGMARNLLAKGHAVTVYNRTRERADALASDGATVAESPAEACKDAEAVLTMLADDSALDDIVFGRSGILEGLALGAAHISNSTISPALSQRLEKAHAAAGHLFLAAPVFGRPDMAAAGKLAVAAAGAPEVIERFRPVLEAIGQKMFIVANEPWKANVLKLAGNFMIASMLEAFGEAITLLRKNGMDPKQFVEIVAQNVFRSPTYENYGGIIAEQRFEPAGFKLKLGLKDIRLFLAAAEEASVPLPLASLLRDQFLNAIAHGHTDQDWAAVSSASANNAGLEE